MLNLLHFIVFGQRFHDDHVILIHCRDKIPVIITKYRTHLLQDVILPSRATFDNQDNSLRIHRNIELLRPAVNVHQKQVIQQQVFDKVILIEALFIRHKQVLNLECSHLSDHINIFTGAAYNQNIFQLLLVIDLKKLISLNLLAVCRGIHKGSRLRQIFFQSVCCRRSGLSIHINHT